MIQRRALYHDGQTAQTREVTLSLFADGTVEIVERGGEAAPLALRLSLREVEISPRLGRTPRVLTLPGGATCELPDDDELDRAFAGASRSRLDRALAALERHRLAALLGLAASLGGLALATQLGIPLLAGAVARSLPASVDEKLGEGALAALDERVFEASQLDPEREAQVRALFDELAGVRELQPPATLAFRAGGAAGANAFALPSGIVVVTDQLEQLAPNDPELAAVLAHELGHVYHRHALRGVLQNMGIGVLVSVSLGDVASISSLGAALPTLLVELQYSRRFEREADADAVALLEAANLPPEALASVLERLAGQAAGERPAYLSTHPDTSERVAAIRRATRAGSSPGAP